MGANGVSPVKEILCHYCDLQLSGPQEVPMPDAEPLPHLLTIDQLAEHLGVTPAPRPPPRRRKEGALFKMAEIHQVRPGRDR
jgi:hypothetical protein